ncbi:GbsR/MarR family transcriptional regulator [Lysinibacillus sp. NPDC094177]|uniref:GbsR/MarR family transcriptional regulator n=1 Tax=Lysinibacillus sp. NPDC094177 TaxID=3390580 RepID=UPI003CFCC474
MENTLLNGQQKELIEDFGTYIESSGGARTLGKIWGYLLISSTPKSLDDMVSDLQISKGMASLSVRQGVQISLFRKVGIPGSKRDFYQLHSDAWTSTLHTSIAQGAMMTQYLRRAKELVLEEQAVSTINESIEFFEFVIQQTKQILVQWEERKSSNTK